MHIDRNTKIIEITSLLSRAVRNVLAVRNNGEWEIIVKPPSFAPTFFLSVRFFLKNVFF